MQASRVDRLAHLFLVYGNYSQKMLISTHSAASNVLFVGGISNRVKEDDLRAAFASHGEIVEAKLNVNPSTAISRGYGFIKYSSTNEAENAMNIMNGLVLKGKRIRVTYAVTDPRPAA